MRGKDGVTLIEAVMVMTLLSAVFLVTGSAFLSLLRVSVRERALLQMDQDANRALENVKQTLRGAYIPVAEHPLNYGREIEVKTTDFTSNVTRWNRVLNNGADLIVFLVGLDTEGSGDTMYGTAQDDKRLILGINTPEADSAQVTNGMWEATDVNDTLANLGILDLNPIGDFQLPTNNSASIDLSDARFNDTFSFPAASHGRRHVYGVIRFKPLLDPDGNMYTYDEATLGQDLNNNGNTTDEFVMGGLEIVYPNSVGGPVFARPIMNSSMLLQINRDSSFEDPIFQFASTTSDGKAIKVKMLMFNRLEQTSPLAFGYGGYQLLTRHYDTVINMQLMSVK